MVNSRATESCTAELFDGLASGGQYEAIARDYVEARVVEAGRETLNERKQRTCCG